MVGRHLDVAVGALMFLSSTLSVLLKQPGRIAIAHVHGMKVGKWVNRFGQNDACTQKS